jgi:hypothetical protein
VARWGDATWARGRGWVLSTEVGFGRRVLDEGLADHQPGG